MLIFQHVPQKKLRVDQFEYRRRPVVPIPQAICVAGMDLLELCALWWETNPDEAANHRRSTMRVTLTLSCWHGPAPFLRDQLLAFLNDAECAFASNVIVVILM